MEYKDFFLNLRERVDEKESSTENRIKRLAEKVSEKTDVSVVKVLSAINSTRLLEEWKEAESEATAKDLIDRIKDSPDAPSVGEEVKVQFDKASRGFLTPRQEDINGKTGIVKSRQKFKTGSQMGRYTVEVKKEDGPYKVHNLTPAEVTSTDSSE